MATMDIWAKARIENVLLRFMNVANVSHAAFNHFPSEHWHEIRNQRQLFEQISRDIGIRSKKEWYATALDVIGDKNIAHVLNYYHDGSICDALRIIYPMEEWHPWRFSGLHAKYWQSRTQCKEFFDWLSEKLHLKVFEDWYKVSLSVIEEHGGGEMLNYHDSVARALQLAYPNVKWQPYRFQEDLDGFATLVEDIAVRTSIAFPSQWETVTREQIVQHGGRDMLRNFNNSLVTLLQALYPEYAWQPWRFACTHTSLANDVEQQRLFLDWVARQLLFDRSDCWYAATPQDIIHYGGLSIMNHYGHSMAKMLQTVYPEVKWVLWRFSGNLVKQHYEFFEWLKEHLGIKNTDDWYKVNKVDVDKHGGNLVNKYYEGSLCKALETVYPNIQWLPWKFSRVPNEYWQDKSNHRKFFEWIAKDMRLNQFPDDWYGISYEDIVRQGGSCLLAEYGHSPQKALQAVFPELKWQPWRFQRVHKSFGTEEKHHREFFDWIAKEFEIQGPYDWYRVTKSDIENHGGSTVLQFYDDSPRKALQAIYPENKSKFQYHSIHKDYWEVKKHHRLYFDWFSVQKDIKTTEDWYGVTSNDVIGLGGKHLLEHHYSGSVFKALQSVYPQVDWQSWRLNLRAEDLEQHREVLKTMERQLQVHSPRDWLNVTQQHVQAQPDGRALLNEYGGSLKELLKAHYPVEMVEAEKNKSRLVGFSKSQQFLSRAIRYLFPPEVHIEYNLRLPMLKPLFPDASQFPMQMDIWIPHINFGVEYQGEQHYLDSNFLGGEDGVKYQYFRDLQKRGTCEETEIKLVHVPFWWNCDLHSLAATVKKMCPIPLSPKFAGNQARPITLSFPYPVIIPAKANAFLFDREDYFEPAKGFHWNASVDPIGWWASTRHDGVRILTDGIGTFYTVEGRRLYPPQWVVSLYSQGIPLEFELCIHEDRGANEAMILIQQSSHAGAGSTKSTMWKKAIMYIIDAPRCLGNVKERLEYVKHHTNLFQHENIRFVEQWKVHNISIVFAWRRDINLKAGFILRAVNSGYIQGRTTAFFKVKTRYCETGKVVRYHRQKSMLAVQLYTGKTVWVQSRLSRDKQKANYPIGSVVDIFYTDRLPSGLPKNPCLCSPDSYGIGLEMQQ